MPLSEKGKKILAEMQSQYGAEKGKSVFYASINSGAITGAERPSEHKSSHSSGHKSRKRGR